MSQMHDWLQFIIWSNISYSALCNPYLSYKYLIEAFMFRPLNGHQKSNINKYNF